MTTASDMKITAIAPWYGCNRLLAERVGVELGKCIWVGIPFCGGCPEIPYIKTRSGNANDRHRHLINLARVISDADLKPMLVERLSVKLFHPDELVLAQQRCRDREAATSNSLFGAASAASEPDLEWAIDYFICCWMGASAKAGKRTEFDAYFSARWTANGGDSCRRFRSAIEAIEAWHLALLDWNFTAIDAFDFLSRCKDIAGHAIYADGPWPDDGVEYRYRFTDEQQRRLAERLSTYTQARVVIRFGDHPLIRALYPEDRWTWIRQSSRNQANGECSEVLIINGASNA